ncbi:DUF4258 domain-containing protein [Candidatus Odyssella acanthamoebae]|uniref:NAD(+)--protein-arginine ADP-ribosyltransferase Tre1-like N-terminal domain-containing protein n=1 Tax=Candidatus Odyssella acanthamoebae TaxID=91604 RepID=A0A077AUV5_9PROT|nr:DUF4258 domain-containing protein [Candidatus Paracaedibacter acanthamoebae]AIK96201.1 hypothetical protein ID47_04735 [Candidatus Paracaedibacter acanthamoebae]
MFTTIQELPSLALKDELTKQLEEAEQAKQEMVRLEQELEGAYAELEKIRERLELREKARYNSNLAGDLSVAEDVSSLFLHVSTQSKRTPFVQSMQTTLDRIGDLADLYKGFANKIKCVGQSVDSYAQQYPHMAEKLESVKGYLSQATAHVPQVTSAASYAMAMLVGGLEGMALGSMAGGIGAVPGAVIGMATGYTSAVVADKVIDASAPHIHSKLSEFADYAQSIGRDQLESNRNRYLAEAMGSSALTGLAVVGMTRGKPASKSMLSGLDLATMSHKASFIAKSHLRSSVNRISAEKFINLTKVGHTGFMGKKGTEFKNAVYQRSRNVETSIKGRMFSGHALDQMQNRGIPPSVVENAIKTGKKFEAKNSLNGFYDKANEFYVITNLKGKVVTVVRGKPNVSPNK